MAEEHDETPYDENAIQVLEGLDAVRKRPGMYFGGTGVEAIEHMVSEFVSNVIDLYLSQNATWVRVAIDSDMIEVSDDGPGFPFGVRHPIGEDVVTILFTVLHAGSSRFGHAPHVHLHRYRGLGMAAVNAACEEFHCISWREGKLWVQSFKAGVPEGEQRILEEGDGRGSRIRFKADREIFDAQLPRKEAVRELLERATILFAGFRASFEGEWFEHPDGLADYVRYIDEEAADEALFHLRHESDAWLLEAAASGYAGEDGTQWTTWVNGSPTIRHGVHKDAFEQVLRERGWTPAHAALHLTCREPRYGSPVTDELLDARAEGIDEVLRDALRAWQA